MENSDKVSVDGGGDSYQKAAHDRDVASLKGFFLRQAKETAAADDVLLLPDRSEMAYHGKISSESFPVLILIHGFAGSYASWRDLIPKLSPFLNVISVSLRGWGDSRDNGPSPSIATYAADVSFLLDSLKVTKASVVGYEMGGAVALQLAQTDKRIETVSYIDASAKPIHPLGVEAVEKELASWAAGPNEEFLTTFLGLDSLTQQKLISRSYAEGLLANACKPTCETYLPAWRSYCEYNVVGAVKALTIPLQFIWCGAVSEDDKSNNNMRVPVTVQNSFIRSINLRDPSQIDFTTSGKGSVNVGIGSAGEVKDCLVEFLAKRDLVAHKWTKAGIEESLSSTKEKKNSKTKEGGSPSKKK